MKKRIKNRWVKALRSDKYRQGEGYLKTEVFDDESNKEVEAYCCLGVLCDIYIKSKEGQRCRAKFNQFNYFAANGKSLDCSFLPEKVQKWAGLDDPDPIIDGTTLSERNDTGLIFHEIADVIEQNL